jgi:hypothetical protein
MSRHPELGAGHPDNFDDRGPADYVCDSCLRTIYSGLLTRVDGKLLCGKCAPSLREVAARHSTDDIPECDDGTHHVLELARNVLEARPTEGFCDHCGQFAPCTERRIAAAFVEVMDVALRERVPS